MTLWQLLREHDIDLVTAQHICDDALINGVSTPCTTARIWALEAALREIINLEDLDAFTMQDIASAALAHKLMTK
jgi:hypothetical protein